MALIQKHTGGSMRKQKTQHMCAHDYWHLIFDKGEKTRFGEDIILTVLGQLEVHILEG